MLKVKGRIAAPLGMALLFVSLTAIPLSLAFRASGNDRVIAAQPGVNDVIGPMWPFAYVLNGDAGIDDTAEPVPAPGCETHVARNEIQKHIPWFDSCGRPYFDSSFEDFEASRQADDCDKSEDLMSDDAIASTGIHPAVKRSHHGRLIARRQAPRSETGSMSVIAVRASMREATRETDCRSVSVTAARELTVCLVRLAMLVKDLRFSEEAGIALKITSACDEATKENTTTVTVEAEGERTEQPRKILRMPPPDEEVCYPEF